MKRIAQFLFLLLLVSVAGVHAQTLTNGQVWRYQLTDGAAIMDDCPICDRVSIWEPLRGSFDLVGTAVAGQYVVTNIQFRTVGTTERLVIGGGTLKYSGTAPTLTLDVSIFNGDAGQIVHMTNSPPESARVFPIIGANANEDTASLTRVYRLRIQAAPIRELWFSTADDFNRAPAGFVSAGDLLASSGRVVKRNSELTERLSIPEGDVGLDAVDVGPRGEIFFSTTTNVESAVNGPITHGDIVTSEGRLYLQSAQLLSAFGVDDPDAGLDALHIAANEEIYFSITKEIPRVGASTLHRGDILSNSGRIVRTEANLFARWNLAPGTSAGVDALHIWPNGEIWFSTETGFTNNAAVVVSPGDIISDQGYVAFRNDAVVSAFDPTDRSGDYGLDAMVIVSDAAASKASTRFVDVAVNENGVDLRWDGTARFFQVERAEKVEGPYGPITAIIVEQSAHDSTLGPTAFYRIRQW